MMVLCILLAMLSLFLSLKLIYQRKLVQKVKKQIDFLIDRDTQTEIRKPKLWWKKRMGQYRIWLQVSIIF